MAGLNDVLVEDNQVITVAPTPQPTAAEEVPLVANLRRALSGAGKLAALFSYEKDFLRSALDEIEQIVRDGVKAKEDKSSLTDTLLETVLDLEQAHNAVAKQADTIVEYRHQLRLLEQDEEVIRRQAIEAERTIKSLTRLEPGDFETAANALEAIKDQAIALVQRDPMFGLKLAAQGAATPSQIEELARQFRELAIAVERANAGFKVPR